MAVSENKDQFAKSDDRAENQFVDSEDPLADSEDLSADSNDEGENLFTTCALCKNWWQHEPHTLGSFHAITSMILNDKHSLHKDDAKNWWPHSKTGLLPTKLLSAKYEGE